ncbi:YceI family protein [Nocardia stercoris]|uniref:YceI family protein n=1 Tax=Nocardia stercoris TaxID=2483361 RepID=A0A3M2KX86_9NOCA|nr:YceI family protein [Nocardia stercoris]
MGGQPARRQAVATPAFRSEPFPVGPRFQVTGEVTLAGVTRPLTLEVTVRGLRAGSDKLRFTATGTILRSDFRVAAGVPNAMLSDKFDIELDIEVTAPQLNPLRWAAATVRLPIVADNRTIGNLRPHRGRRFLILRFLESNNARASRSSYECVSRRWSHCPMARAAGFKSPRHWTAVIFVRHTGWGPTFRYAPGGDLNSAAHGMVPYSGAIRRGLENPIPALDVVQRKSPSGSSSARMDRSLSASTARTFVTATAAAATVAARRIQRPRERTRPGPGTTVIVGSAGAAAAA